MEGIPYGHLVLILAGQCLAVKNLFRGLTPTSPDVQSHWSFAPTGAACVEIQRASQILKYLATISSNLFGRPQMIGACTVLVKLHVNKSVPGEIIDPMFNFRSHCNYYLEDPKPPNLMS